MAGHASNILYMFKADTKRFSVTTFSEQSGNMLIAIFIFIQPIFCILREDHKPHSAIGVTKLVVWQPVSYDNDYF